MLLISIILVQLEELPVEFLVKAGLVVINYLTFCLAGSFISSLFPQDSFTG